MQINSLFRMILDKAKYKVGGSIPPDPDVGIVPFV